MTRPAGGPLRRGTARVGAALAGAWGVSALAGMLVPGPDLGTADARRAAGAAPRVATATGSPANSSAPLVSVVIPMRDEARNASAVLRSVLAQDHPALEVVAVDDRSSDGTAAIVRAVAAADPRVRLLEGRPLPPGWVGKPWACAQGAAAARGDWLLFLDADVRLAPAALRLLLWDAETHGAAVESWVGHQELVTFWERAVNPVVFFFIAALTPLPLARMPGVPLVAVNGQFLAFRREAYEEVGGHAAVHDAVVDDLALGQAAKRRYGRGYRFLWARELMTTRMYHDLGEIRRGWGKNIALGGAAVGLPPALVVCGALVGGVLPWAGTAARLLGARAAATYPVAAALQVAAVGILGRRVSGLPLRWGLAAPAGTLMVALIAADSWRRTHRGAVSWRGRRYAARR